MEVLFYIRVVVWVNTGTCTNPVAYSFLVVIPVKMVLSFWTVRWLACSYTCDASAVDLCLLLCEPVVSCR